VWKELDCVALQRWRELQSSTRSKGEGLKEARVRKEKKGFEYKQSKLACFFLPLFFNLYEIVHSR